MGRVGTGARVEDFYPACDGLWYLYDESPGGGFCAGDGSGAFDAFYPSGRAQ